MLTSPNNSKDGQFGGELPNIALDQVHLAQIGSSAQDVFRQKSDISQIADANCRVTFQLEGQGVVEHLGHQAYCVKVT